MKPIIIILTALLCAVGLHAQTEIRLSQYYRAPALYNPAAIGMTDNIQIVAGSRMQWLGVTRAPKTFAGTADMPLLLAGQRIGVGVELQQSTMGLYTQLNAGAQFAYKLKRWGGQWSFGARVAYADQGFKGSLAEIPDDDDYHDSNDDGIPRSDVHGGAVDLGAGVWYQRQNWYAGVAGLHLTAPGIRMKVDSDAGGTAAAGSERYFEYNLPRTVYFTAGGNIPIKNTLLEILPSVIVTSDFTFTGGQADLRTRYRKMLSVGVGYRWRDAVSVSVAGEFKNFFIAYNYDYSTTAIARITSGSHEVMAGYNLKLDLSDKNKHRQKSIRLF